MALFITIDLNPTPTQTGGDDCFQPAVIGVVRVVSFYIYAQHTNSHDYTDKFLFGCEMSRWPIICG